MSNDFRRSVSAAPKINIIQEEILQNTREDMRERTRDLLRQSNEIIDNLCDRIRRSKSICDIKVIFRKNKFNFFITLNSIFF